MNVYEIPGKPISWKRARRCGNRYFDSQSKDKHIYQDIIAISHKALYNLSEPLKLTLEFHMPIPNSWSNQKRLKAENTPHIFTPDCDNLTKFICDTFNGILWHDDALIYELHARKCYGQEPKTRIYIELFDDKPLLPLVPR